MPTTEKPYRSYFGHRPVDHIPPFIVEKYAKSLVQMMLASSLLGAVFTVTGLWFSYRYNLTSGASIIMVSSIVFLISLVVDMISVAMLK